MLARRDDTHWQYVGVARQTDTRGLWSLPAVDYAMWRLWGTSTLDKAEALVETLLARPEADR